MEVEFKPEVNLVEIKTKFAHLMDFDKHPDLGILLHNALAKQMDPYVPMDTGMLSTSRLITPHYVEYTQPYAHYQYTGIVYGPNIPVIENGIVTGWFSPPGKGSKQPTGKQIQYSTEMHPLATHHWDKAMMRDKGDVFVKEVGKIIKRWLKNNGK